MPRRRGPSCRPTTSDSGGTSLMNIRDLVLVDGVRTPMIDYNGPFAEVSAIDLAAHAARALLDRLGVEGSEIDHAVVGSALQTSPAAISGARHVALKAGLPHEVPALTVNRLCGSGIQSVISGAPAIPTGEGTTCLVGGMENMSQTPHVIWGARRGFKLGQGKLEDLLMVALFDSYCGYYMAQTSNNLARDYGITRAEPAPPGRVAGSPRRWCRSRSARARRPSSSSATTTCARTARWRTSPRCRRRSIRTASSPTATPPASSTAPP